MRKAASAPVRAAALSLLSFAIALGAAAAAPPSEPSSSIAAAPAVAAAPAAPAEPTFPVEEYRLSSGLRVILAPDASLPSVTVMVRYDVGSKDDPEGLGGVAHLVEHLMFERSRHVPNGALLRLLSEAGATDLNGTTTLDSTVYYETLPPERLPLALWLESDRMGFFVPALDEAVLEQERGVVINELRTRVLDVPGGIAPVAVYDATFPSWHPYHTTPGGNEEELRRIRLADVKAFAGTWYGPANATLILAGKLDVDRTKALVDRYFATLTGRPPPPRPALPALSIQGETRVEIAADIATDDVRLTWVTPAAGAPGDAALDRVASLLAGDEASRLEKRLVGSGLARAVSAGQLSRRLASVFQIQASAAVGRRAEEIIEVVDRELRDLAEKGPTDLEMKRVQSAWATSDMFDLETSMGRAERLMIAAGRGPLSSPFDWTDRAARALGAADVRAAVASHLSPEGRAGVIITRYRKKAPLSGVVVRRDEP